tara:strand:+ start:214 stop:462 length:249 start_codon:yes stop_codon:yes gene_type:complete
MKNYTTIIHENSRNSERHRLCGWFINKHGEREFRNNHTKQSFRDPEGGPLPHKHTIHRTSKYVPHIGKKHAAKLEKRAALNA